MRKQIDIQTIARKLSKNVFVDSNCYLEAFDQETTVQILMDKKLRHLAEDQKAIAKVKELLKKKAHYPTRE